MHPKQIAILTIYTQCNSVLCTFQHIKNIQVCSDGKYEKFKMAAKMAVKQEKWASPSHVDKKDHP